MPSFNLLNGTVSFDREVALRYGVVEEWDHQPVATDAPVTYKIIGHALNQYVQLWSVAVDIRAHNLKITQIGDILDFGWVNIITASERKLSYKNKHVVRDCVLHLPTWDSAGTRPWYQGDFFSTAGTSGSIKVKEDEIVEGVFFNDAPNTPPYPDIYEHNGIPLGRIHYYNPHQQNDELESIRGQDKYVACLAFKDARDNWAVPWHVCWQVDFSADIATAIDQTTTVTVDQHSKTLVYTHDAIDPRSLLLQVLGKDGSEDCKNFELL